MGIRHRFSGFFLSVTVSIKIHCQLPNKYTCVLGKTSTELQTHALQAPCRISPNVAQNGKAARWNLILGEENEVS